MAKSLQLRFTKITTPEQVDAYESQLVILNGSSGVHLDMEGSGNSINILRSMTGMNFVSCYHDYFKETFDEFINQPGIGQVIKIRVNKLPLLGYILGDIEEGGDVNPEDPNDLTNAFGCIDGDYFLGSEGDYFLGKNQ